LFLLLAGHLATNYAGVRGVVLRSLNRQRAGIAWTTYRIDAFSSPDFCQAAKTLTPGEVASIERIFEWPGVLRNGCTNKIMGYCTIGSSFSTVSTDAAHSQSLLRIFLKERYILCFDARSIPRERKLKMLRMHICLKEGHTPLDQLKAWVHAEEIGRIWTAESIGHRNDSLTFVIESTYRTVNVHFNTFVKHMRGLRWNLDEGALMTGSPKALFMSADEAPDGVSQEKKKDI
jgi:hypothetical protein